MQALKILVIVLGLLLIAGVVALGVGIAYRLHHPSAAPSPTTAPRVTFGGAPRLVTLPAGAKILGAQSDGDRVMVRLGLTDGSERLMLLDWKTGAILSTLNLK
jgi:Family of unknown function (DUF6476)